MRGDNYLRKIMFKATPFIYLIIFLCIARISANAQIVEWSNQSKVKSKTTFTQIIGENSSGVFLARCHNNDFRREVILERYKSNLAMDLTSELVIPSNNVLEKIILLENNLLVFVSGRNNITGKIELSCIKLDLDFKLVGNLVFLCDVEPKLFKDNSSFYIKPCADKTKFTVVFIRTANDKTGSITAFNVFSDQLSSLNKKEISFTYDVSDVFFSSMECDNEGNIFCLIDFPKTPNKNRSSDPRNFNLYSYYSTTDKITEYEIGKDSVFINELGLTVNNFNKSVCVTGFYSYKQDNRVAGEFYYRFDIASNLLKAKCFEDLSKNFVSKIAANMQNESSPALSDLFIRKIIPRSDGGCLTIAEKYYETKQSYTYYVNGFPQTNYRIVYNFDEIVLISKNADGTTQFKDYIKKNQSSMSDAGYYLSFVTVTGNDKIGLVYNSDANNEGDVMISTISNKGVADTKVLLKALSYFVQVIPGETKQVSSNSSLICTLKDKRFSIMRLTF